VAVKSPLNTVLGGMESEHLLLTAAEVAIALAGFTGIVVVFGSRDGRWSNVDIVRMKAALGASFGTAFLAFVPSTIHLFGIEGSLLWRISSGIFLVYVVSVIVWQLGHRKTLTDSDWEVLNERGRWLMGTAMIGSVVANLCNVLGIGIQPSLKLYFLALLLYMLTGAYLFVRILLVRPREE
jgi:hypothetical protein